MYKRQQYEISSGLTMEDKIAFPYGKKVKEGAKTEEGSMQDLYSLSLIHI